MTILVTGANGQLGNEMRLLALRSRDRFVFTDICDAQAESVAMLQKLAGANVDYSTVKLDITDLVAVRSMVASEGVDVIVNCAGYTNVDAAESHADAAELLNAKAVENLAVAMKEVGGLLVHMSTDYVFGSKYNTPIPEDAVTAPESVYGQSKWHGEEAIRRVGGRSVIIRTAWLYSEFGKNFVKTMLRLTAEKPSLKVVFDQVGTPTYAGDLAEAIAHVIASTPSVIPSEASVSQTFHFTNEGVCSWYDFAKTIAEYAGHTACDIQPCHSDEFPSPVRRPAYSVLDKTKIKETFGLRIPYWTDSLKRCLKNL
ncbi:MAG: dTDP-4-dehydrorhamnose reductase [Candidatus Cryptobacteroides sp.]|nr:dTDP-4-dehydrorhamnose reductase [Candidatus Cryptobacteroides sp.]